MPDRIKVNGITTYQSALDKIAECKRENNVTLLGFWKMTVRANFANKTMPDFDTRWKQLVDSL